jgi:Kef-type K+ transport system membrane component KefB
MSWLHTIHETLEGASLPTLLVVGVMTLLAFYAGRSMKIVRLPSIIGFMLIGVILGPSLFGVLYEKLQVDLSFITEIALGFVALSIGLELNLASLKRLGWGMILIIFAESFLAFAAVSAGIYLLTRDLPLSLIFGAVAPASAPAGTVAVIQEYRAQGNLTKALYAVVGFDDGLGIIIFGFAAAIARSILLQDSGGAQQSAWLVLATPLKEVGLSVLLGGAAALFYGLLVRRLEQPRDIFVLTFAVALITIGLSSFLHMSLILTNMILGLVVVNTRPRGLVEKIRGELTEIMPLLFILFFVLAGASLHIALLPSLGLVGLIYIVSRAAGLMGGAWIGSVLGRAEANIRKYLGLGILSQAGVAIGLSLIVKQEFTPLGAWGASIGTAVITTVTATSIVFEIVGPILTKIGLQKAGEIPDKADT